MLLPEGRRKKVIGQKEVEAVIAKIARIPPKSVSKSDTEALKQLETDLKRAVYGQDDASPDPRWLRPSGRMSSCLHHIPRSSGTPRSSLMQDAGVD